MATLYEIIKKLQETPGSNDKISILKEHTDNAQLKWYLRQALCPSISYYFTSKTFPKSMTVGDEDYYIHPEIIAANDIRFWGSCGRQFQDPWKMLTMPVRTLAFVGSREQVKEMEREFPTLKLPMFASGHGADVVEKGNSKADGLRRLAVYFGEKEDLSDTVAFGDSMNDIEVVQEAGIGVARIVAGGVGGSDGCGCQHGGHGCRAACG
jgi:hydroxymethylpyrimidine pyrophosphatase-like HAD family hydrolase